MKRIIYLAIATLITVFALGCSQKVTVVPYSNDALYNYQAGKAYAAAGRFELAKERFTLAMAANRDPQMQDVLARELNSINMMIETLR